MTISIVTIARNDLAGIQRTFSSLREQTNRNVQHVVIDGASTDGTAEWAMLNPVFSDTTVLSEPDSGIYAAMNKGLRLANGELVCFLNSGDLFAYPNVLSMVVESHSAMRWSWAYGFGRMVNETGLTTARGRIPRVNSWWHNTFWSYDICHQAVFMPPQLALAHGGFDESYRLAADYRLITAVGRSSQPHVFGRVLAITLAGGVSDTHPAESLLETHRARVELFELRKFGAKVDLVWTHLLLGRSLSRRFVGRRLRQLGLLDGGEKTPPGPTRSPPS